MTLTRLTVLGALVALSSPSFAQAPGPGSAGASPTSQQVQAGAEQRIKSLHDRLHITAAEEQNWQAFTAVMRENAQQTAATLDARQKNFGGMNAVQDLQSYADMTQQQSQQISRLVGPFQTLYAQFSPDQKQAADGIFHNYTSRATAHPRG